MRTSVCFLFGDVRGAGIKQGHCGVCLSCLPGPRDAVGQCDVTHCTVNIYEMPLLDPTLGKLMSERSLGWELFSFRTIRHFTIIFWWLLLFPRSPRSLEFLCFVHNMLYSFLEGFGIFCASGVLSYEDVPCIVLSPCSGHSSIFKQKRKCLSLYLGTFYLFPFSISLCRTPA